MPGQRLTKLQCYSEREAGFRLTRLASLSSASYFTLCVMVPLNKPVLKLSSRDMLNCGFCSAPQGDIRANITPIVWHQTNVTRLNHRCRAHYPNVILTGYSLMRAWLIWVMCCSNCWYSHMLVVKPVQVTADGAHHKHEFIWHQICPQHLSHKSLKSYKWNPFSPVNYCATHFHNGKTILFKVWYFHGNSNH